jgi:hypothetical protein
MAHGGDEDGNYLLATSTAKLAAPTALDVSADKKKCPDPE